MKHKVENSHFVAKPCGHTALIHAAKPIPIANKVSQ